MQEEIANGEDIGFVGDIKEVNPKIFMIFWKKISFRLFSR